MIVLLIGSGGREHALAWKIAQSPLLTRLVAAPGNLGMATLCETRAVAVTDVAGLVALALALPADLVVIGPEVALEAGLADALTAVGIDCFGPTRGAAQIETSKAFTKALCRRHGLPTADYAVFDDHEAALSYLDSQAAPFVIKADGLAAGKGVVIAETRDAADQAVRDMLAIPGGRIVIEAFMIGEEVSLFALADGERVMLFGGAQDHKRAYDNDQGPNTGGMGTHAPVPALSDVMAEQVCAGLIAPAVRALASEGLPYRGVVFAGLMLTDTGPKLVEFNARFGDPETQTLMLRLESDLLPYLMAAATGRLDEMAAPVWRDEAAICVVLAAGGYPSDPQRGAVITGADAELGTDTVVFHAGTARNETGALIAAGGRVLNVCARGGSVEIARERAYQALKQIHMPGGFYRRDIGVKGIP